MSTTTSPWKPPCGRTCTRPASFDCTSADPDVAKPFVLAEPWDLWPRPLTWPKRPPVFPASEKGSSSPPPTPSSPGDVKRWICDSLKLVHCGAPHLVLGFVHENSPLGWRQTSRPWVKGKRTALLDVLKPKVTQDETVTLTSEGQTYFGAEISKPSSWYGT